LVQYPFCLEYMLIRDHTVARVVHYIRKHLVGKTLAKVTAEKDENVFGKVGTSAEEMVKQLTGKKVVDARQQGKYFWYVVVYDKSLIYILS